MRILNQSVLLYFLSTLINLLALGDQLPVINQIGVIPAQYDRELWTKLPIAGFINPLTHDLISESKRFRTLEGDLVAELWNTPEGREELTKSYRLDAFLNLSLVMKKDHVIATARLMSSEMKLYLQESEIWSTDLARTSDQNQIKVALKGLLYRLFNILPIDINITSIQDSFLTLSGGIEQSIHVGDSVKLVRVSLKSLHPALGTWQSFDVRNVGEARIIESRNNVAVAKLTSEVQAGGIAVGDGAHIEGILSRRLFASEAEKAVTFESPSILIPPLKVTSPIPEEISDSATGKNEKNLATKPGASDFSKTKDVDPSSLTPVRSADASETSETETQALPQGLDLYPQAATTEKSSSLVLGGYQFRINNWDLSTGHSMWSFTNQSETATKWVFFPPVNTFGGRAEASIGGGLELAGDLELGYGRTENGSFQSYEAGLSGRWRGILRSTPLIQSWFLGLKAGLVGKNIDGESLGGIDIVQGGLEIGMRGTIPASKSLAFEASYRLVPLNIGRIGYAGTFKTLRSSMGSELNAQVFSGYKYLGLELGGRLQYRDYNMLDSAGKETVFNRTSIEGVARMNLN